MAVNLGKLEFKSGEVELLLGEIYRVQTTDHNQLRNRNMADQHSIESITNLKQTLDKVQETQISGFLSDFEIQQILNT